ncbi:hypothetical protein BV25DRAFT_914729 [Artomyces pyxidatus]|uniref:Uncharacterized protein n=1 Tax=Artomyces pyxidatus TaxID=48021 RepID=A0ACB8SXH8_9AGAM|nr:hypothetical protein BV25DRAFT_914729 [Artomyces pyxidatus]
MPQLEELEIRSYAPGQEDTQQDPAELPHLARLSLHGKPRALGRLFSHLRFPATSLVRLYLDRVRYQWEEDEDEPGGDDSELTIDAITPLFDKLLRHLGEPVPLARHCIYEGQTVRISCERELLDASDGPPTTFDLAWHDTATTCHSVARELLSRVPASVQCLEFDVQGAWPDGHVGELLELDAMRAVRTLRVPTTLLPGVCGALMSGCCPRLGRLTVVAAETDEEGLRLFQMLPECLKGRRERGKKIDDLTVEVRAFGGGGDGCEEQLKKLLPGVSIGTTKHKKWLHAMSQLSARPAFVLKKSCILTVRGDDASKDRRSSRRQRHRNGNGLVSVADLYKKTVVLASCLHAAAVQRADQAPPGNWE